MDYSEEIRFVNQFIRADKRERLLYELTTPKKRISGLDRFCHQTSDLIDTAKIRLTGSDLERQQEFVCFVMNHKEICRIISADLWLDEYLLFPEAVGAASKCSDAVIILGNTFAVIFTEAMKGGRDKYLLCDE